MPARTDRSEDACPRCCVRPMGPGHRSTWPRRGMSRCSGLAPWTGWSRTDWSTRCPTAGSAFLRRRQLGREGDQEGGALARLGPPPGVAAVGHHEPLDDRQSQAEALGVAALRRLGAGPPLEELSLLVQVDARPLVAYLDADTLCFRDRRDGDRAVLSAVLHRVAHEVVDDLAHHPGVAG